MFVARGGADYFDAMTVLGETVDEGDDAGSAPEGVAPLLEGELGSDDGGPRLVASGEACGEGQDAGSGVI